MFVTEALAEIATIAKRLTKKQESILAYTARDDRGRDPLEKQGGSEAHVAAERQSFRDLNERLVALRGKTLVKPDTETYEGNVVVNLDEKKLREEIERLETMFGALDGALSLKNATTEVEA